MNQKSLSKIIFNTAIIFFIIAVFYYIAMNPIGVSTGKLNLTIEKVETAELRKQGLSDRESLCENCGMLFVFPESGYYPFWMKDMNFDIDIIYMDENMKIVDIFENVSKESYYKVPPDTVQNTSLAKYVLEINSGKSKILKLRVGDTIKL